MPKIISAQQTALSGRKMMVTTAPGGPVGFCPPNCPAGPATIYIHLPPGTNGNFLIIDAILGLTCQIQPGHTIQCDMVFPPLCEWTFVTGQPASCLGLAQGLVYCINQFWTFSFFEEDAAGVIIWSANYVKPVVAPPAVPEPMGGYVLIGVFAPIHITVVAPPLMLIDLVP